MKSSLDYAFNIVFHLKIIDNQFTVKDTTCFCIQMITNIEAFSIEHDTTN